MNNKLFSGESEVKSYQSSRTLNRSIIITKSGESGGDREEEEKHNKYTHIWLESVEGNSNCVESCGGEGDKEQN